MIRIFCDDCGDEIHADERCIKVVFLEKAKTSAEHYPAATVTPEDLEPMNHVCIDCVARMKGAVP